MRRQSGVLSLFSILGGVGLLLLALFASGAAATTSMNIEYGPAGQTRTAWSDQDMVGIQLSNGTWEFTGGRTFIMDGGGGTLDVDWDFTTNADPFVDGVFSFTNNTGSTQDLVLTYSVSVVPSLPVATGGASVIGSMTVDSGGGTLGHVLSGGGTPDPMYTTLVDGSVFETLLNFDSTLTVPFGSAATPSESFGLPGLTKPVPGGVSTSIGSRLSFSVTPGDSVAFTSRFEVVPEPSTALLLGFGLLALKASGRRSNADTH